MALLLQIVAAFVSAAAMVLISAGAGRAVRIASGLPRGNAMVFAEPVLGFGWMSILATIAYRHGVPPALSLWVFAGLGALGFALSWWRSASGLGFRDAAPLALALPLMAIAALPPVIGGAQFHAFQGDIVDAFNYIANTTAFSQHDFAFLRDVSGETGRFDNFTLFASQALIQRPSINAAEAMFLPLLFGPVFEKSWVFLLFLQILIFFALMFAALSVNAQARRRSVLIATAGAGGFLVQYIIDISAWSQLGATSALIVAVTLAVQRMQALATAPAAGVSPPRLALALTAAIVPIAYIYPEMLVPLGFGMLGALAVFCPGLSRARTLVRALAVLMLAAALTLLCCMAYWDGTIAFFLRTQMKFGASIAETRTHWHQYYQRYVFDASIREAGYTGWYAVLSWPVDAFYGLTGLYFLRPPFDWPFTARLFSKLALLPPMAGLIWGAVRAAWPGRDDGAPPARGFAAFVLGATALSLLFLATGRYWLSGKIFVMVGPLAFLALCLPLLTRGAPRWTKIAAALFVAGHMGFGVARIIRAGDDNGIPYAFPPYPTIANMLYPGVSDPSLKHAIDWDIGAVSRAALECRHVLVEIHEPFMDQYVQMALTQLRARWSSVLPLNAHFGAGTDLGVQPPVPDADCLMRLEDGARGRQAVTLVRRDADGDFPRRHVADGIELLTRYRDDILLTGFARAGVDASGFYREILGKGRIEMARPDPPMWRLGITLDDAAGAGEVVVRADGAELRLANGAREALLPAAGAGALVIEVYGRDSGKPPRVRSLRLSR